MATAAVQVPSRDRLEPGSSKIQALPYPDAHPIGKVDVNFIASEWIEKLNQALSDENYLTFKDLFLKNSCWRDQLGLSWDFHTLLGPEKMASFLQESGSTGSCIKSLRIDDTSSIRKPTVSAIDFNGKVNGVTSFLNIDTHVGRGRGVVRLLQDPEDGWKWKAFILFTAMHELKGFEETVKTNRPHGVDHGGQPGRKNWQERRHVTENFEDGNEPTVLILGA